MKRFSMLIGLLILLASSALAQNDFPTVETSPAFMYIRTPISDATRSVSFNCAGAGGTLAYNFTSALGIAFDGGGCKFFGQTFNLGQKLNGNQFLFLFGPRITFRNSTKFTPFIDVNFGGDRLSITCKSSSPDCNNLTRGATISKTAFAMTAGGGFDIKMNRKVAIRLVQADYLYTRFGNSCAINFCGNNNNQNSFRLKSGIVIGWGGSASSN